MPPCRTRPLKRGTSSRTPRRNSIRSASDLSARSIASCSRGSRTSACRRATRPTPASPPGRGCPCATCCARRISVRCLATAGTPRAAATCCSPSARAHVFARCGSQGTGRASRRSPRSSSQPSRSACLTVLSTWPSGGRTPRSWGGRKTSTWPSRAPCRLRPRQPPTSPRRRAALRAPCTWAVIPRAATSPSTPPSCARTRCRTVSCRPSRTTVPASTRTSCAARASPACATASTKRCPAPPSSA